MSEGGRIGRLLRVRRLLEGRALGELAAGQRRLREAERALERRREVHARRPQPVGTVTPLQLRALELQGLASFAGVEEAGEWVGEASAEEEALRSAWTRSAVQRGSVERLHERRRAAAVAAGEAVRARALEELVILLHGRKP